MLIISLTFILKQSKNMAISLYEMRGATNPSDFFFFFFFFAIFGTFAEKKSKPLVSQLVNADDTSVIEIKTQHYLES